MVTIPTIDQISGTTVMNKLRSLINAFINYANDMDEEITVISTQSSSAYEIATQTAASVQTNFYTKSEVDTLLSRRAYDFDCMDPLFKIQYSAYMERIGIHLDGETIINSISGLAVNIDDNTLYYDTVSGKVKALSYSAGVGTSMNLAREISVNVGDGLYVNTNNIVMSKIDGDTIKFDSNGVMYVPIDNNTIKYDSTNGVIYASGSYSAGDGIKIDNGVISTKSYTFVGNYSGASPLYIEISSQITNNNISIKHGDMFYVLDTVSSPSSSSTLYIPFSGARTVNTKIPLWFVSSSSKFGYYNIDTTVLTGDASAKIKYICGLDGVVIDSSNISTYIDSSNNYSTLKPFVVYLEISVNFKTIHKTVIYLPSQTRNHITEGFSSSTSKYFIEINVDTQSLYTLPTTTFAVSAGYYFEFAYNEVNSVALYDKKRIPYES